MGDMGSTARQPVFSQASARHCKKESPPAARPSGFESLGRSDFFAARNAKSTSSTRRLGLVRADRRRIDPNRTRAFFRRAKRAGFFQAFRYAFGGRTRQCGSNFMRPQLDLAPGTSKLGSWSYEVYDCKFAKGGKNPSTVALFRALGEAKRARAIQTAAAR
jgi:hypothetical protein